MRTNQGSKQRISAWTNASELPAVYVTTSRDTSDQFLSFERCVTEERNMEQYEWSTPALCDVSCALVKDKIGNRKGKNTVRSRHAVVPHLVSCAEGSTSVFWVNLPPRVLRIKANVHES